MRQKSSYFYFIECLADFLEVEPQEIFFTSGGTESDNWAIKSLLLENLRGRPNIITSAVEHKAVLNSCAAMKKLGATLTKLPVDKFGVVKPDVLRDKILPQTKIISVMLANNEIGTIQPVELLAGIAHAAGKIFHTDAVQALGHIPVDVKILDVDMLSAARRNFLVAQEPKMFRRLRQWLWRSKKNCRDMQTTAEKLSLCAETLLGCLKKNGVDFILNGAEFCTGWI